MARPVKIKLWMLIVAGPFLIWSGISEYQKLAEFEESGGTIWIGRTTKMFYSMGGKSAVLLVWCALGAFYLFLCYRYFKIRRESSAQIEAAEERIAAVERQRAAPSPVPPPREPPPRIGDDPFRDPPGPKPIIVQKAEIAGAPAPRASTPAVSSDATDGPKFLK